MVDEINDSGRYTHINVCGGMCTVHTDIENKYTQIHCVGGVAFVLLR